MLITNNSGKVVFKREVEGKIVEIPFNSVNDFSLYEIKERTLSTIEKQLLDKERGIAPESTLSKERKSQLKSQLKPANMQKESSNIESDKNHCVEVHYNNPFKESWDDFLRKHYVDIDGKVPTSTFAVRRNTNKKPVDSIYIPEDIMKEGNYDALITFKYFEKVYKELLKLPTKLKNDEYVLLKVSYSIESIRGDYNMLSPVGYSHSTWGVYPKSQPYQSIILNGISCQIK